MSPKIPTGQVPSSITTVYTHNCQVLTGGNGDVIGEAEFCTFHGRRVEVVDEVDPTTGSYSPKPTPRCVETGVDLWRVGVLRRDGVQLW